MSPRVTASGAGGAAIAAGIGALRSWAVRNIVVLMPVFVFFLYCYFVAPGYDAGLLQTLWFGAAVFILASTAWLILSTSALRNSRGDAAAAPATMSRAFFWAGLGEAPVILMLQAFLLGAFAIAEEGPFPEAAAGAPLPLILALAVTLGPFLAVFVAVLLPLSRHVQPTPARTP